MPTVAFGVPGSAGMAILLGAFLIHGLVPGPDMLTKNLNITYSMVWSIAIANILGAGLCYLFSGQFAKLATLRYTLILPGVLGIIYIGAFEGSRQWGDLFSLLFFGVLGWTMKQLQVAAPAADPRLRARRHHRALHVHLGRALRHRMAAASDRHGAVRLALLGLLRPLVQDVRRNGGPRGMLCGASARRHSSRRSCSPVHDHADRRRGRAVAMRWLQRQDRAADRRHDGVLGSRCQPVQRGVPQDRARRRGLAERRARSATASIWIWTPTPRI